MNDAHGLMPDFDTSRAHPARVYNYLLGGKDHYPADQEAAERLLALLPHGRDIARANRDFLHRAVRHLAMRGISQFLDIGVGLPVTPNVHEIAQGIIPESRVVYADNDPIVLAHAEALLTSGPRGTTDYLQADLRNPAAILDTVRDRGVIDLSQPVGLLLVAVLHFLEDSDRPEHILTDLLAALPAGSCLVLSHVTDDFSPGTMRKAEAVYQDAGKSVQIRSHTQIGAYFDGLALLSPGAAPGQPALAGPAGLVPVHRWQQPDPAEWDKPPADIACYGGIGLKAAS
ncbi:SAM-dependent methyltransferase [Streptomyces sp. NPDC055025]